MRKIKALTQLGVSFLGLMITSTVEFEFYLWEKIAEWLTKNPKSATAVHPKGLVATVKLIAKALRWGSEKGKDGTRSVRRALLAAFIVVSRREFRGLYRFLRVLLRFRP